MASNAIASLDAWFVRAEAALAEQREHGLSPKQRRQLFWQALDFEDGSLSIEVVSTTYLDRNDQWTPEQEHRLAAGLGPAEISGPIVHEKV